MKTINKYLFCSIILFSLLSLVGCKKDNDNNNDPVNPGGDCEVITYRCDSRNETWRIVYTSSGNIDSILIGDQLNVDEVRKFNYQPNKITINRYVQGTLDEVNHVELSGSKINSIRDVSPISSGWEQVSFIYRADIPALVDKSINTFDGSSSSFETTYQWDINTNGNIFNLTKHSSNSGVFTYEYYIDKPTQPGDYLNFEKIITTYDKYYIPFSSANLLKSIKRDGNPLVDVTYTFDSSGRISSFAVSYDGDPDTEVWKLTYDCK